MMGDLWAFVVAVFSHWVALVTGGVITALLAVWERKRQKTIPTKAYWAVIAFFVLLSFFLAWRDQLSQKRAMSSKIDELQQSIETSKKNNDQLQKNLDQIQALAADQTIVQVNGIILTLNTIQPFREGQPVSVNFTYANTGIYRVHNFHIHRIVQFISSDKELDGMFQSLYKDIEDFNKTGQEGILVDPGNLQPQVVSATIMPSADEVRAFYGGRKMLAIAIRIEYNDTLYYERCAYLIPQNIHGKSEMWNIPAHHNKAGQHPLARLF